MVHLLRVFAFVPLALVFLGYLVLCLIQGFFFGVFSWALWRTWTATSWPLAALVAHLW